MSSGISIVVLLVCALSASSHGFLAKLDNKTRVNIGCLNSGDPNADVDCLLQTFRSSLPSRINIGQLDQRYTSDCVLSGLGSGLWRDGNVILDVTETTATLSFGLSSKRLDVDCNWRKRIGLLKLKGTVKASTDKVSIHAKLALSLAPGKHPTLQEFRVTYLDKIYTRFTGIGRALNWIVVKILNKKAAKAKDRIITHLEKNVSKRLETLLTKYTVPGLQ